MRAFSGSIRWRLTLWYSVSIAVIYFLFAGCVFLTFRHACIAESHTRLDNELALVSDAVFRAPDRLPAIEADFPASDFDVVADQRPLFETHGWTSAGIPARWPIDSNGYGFRTSSTGRHYAVRETTLQLDGRIVQISVAQDSEQTVEHLHKLMMVLFFSLPGILMVSLTGGYFLAGRVLSPIDDMARKARNITADNLSARLTVGAHEDEFNRLARIFNDTFDRLEDAFARVTRFAADASHELRTPLAVIRSLGENAMQGPPEAHRHADTIGSILEETDRLTRLLDGLLTLTRAESGQVPLVFDAVNLGEVSLEVVNCLRVLAEEKAQTLAFHALATLDVTLDQSTFKQALINLLANAIEYTPVSGNITVRVRRGADDTALVEVDDDGPGIAAEHRAHIFERFYRIDRDRSKATGGSGLGLAIARWTIGLNGGTVEFEAKPDRGSIFRIVLPRGEQQRRGLEPSAFNREGTTP